MVTAEVRIEIISKASQNLLELKQTIAGYINTVSNVRIYLSGKRGKGQTSFFSQNQIAALERDLSQLQQENELLREKIIQAQMLHNRTLQRVRQHQEVLDRLSPERRELYERIKNLRAETNSVDFNIVETLQELREPT